MRIKILVCNTFTAIEVYGVFRMIRMTESTVTSLYIAFLQKLMIKLNPPTLNYNNLSDDSCIIIMIEISADHNKIRINT